MTSIPDEANIILVHLKIRIQTNRQVIESQNKVAQVAELVHGTSLYHDDVIDDATMRRAKPTANWEWGIKKVLCSIVKMFHLKLF